MTRCSRFGDHAKAQALHLDICRGFSGNYIVPEQQSGFGSQPGFSHADAGAGRNAPHGAFPRWRAAPTA